MSMTWGQSAWINLKSVGSSETKREVSSNRSSKEYTDDLQWLVGVTDGDGTFHFSEQKGRFTFYFKIAQSTYNLRMLYHIKKILGVGKVQVAVDGMAEYRIRDRKLILKHIIPLFDQHRLLTSKYYHYDLFKKALFIATSSNIVPHSREYFESEKRGLLAKLSAQSTQKTSAFNHRPSDYISPVWSIIDNEVTSLADAKTVMTKSWLVGFTEAEGSFYLFKKGPERLVHAFEITQKLDKIVLVAAAQLLGIRVKDKKKYSTVYADSFTDIPKVITYFHKTMKGMKSLEYRIWARSFNKKGKRSFDQRSKLVYLTKIRDLMRSIRSIRLDKSFNIINRVKEVSNNHSSFE